jgi:hypothetical protein
VAARRELAAQRDRGERVARIAEGGDQEAAALARARGPGRLGQATPAVSASSANSRIICLRASASKATGVVTSVPTPASR